MPDPRPVIAIDLGGTKLSAAVVDPEGNLLLRRKRPATNLFDEIAAEAAAAVSAAALSWSGIAAAGLILPGIFNPCNGRAWAPNLWGAQEVPARDELQRRIPVPLALASDRSGCVLGETWLGAARGLRDVVFVAIGTGVGAGFLAAGNVIEGSAGVAGAVGWWTLGRRAGSWESQAAGPAVARKAGCPTAEEAATLARAGHPRALAAFAEAAEWIGAGVANLISCLNPEMVVLGGGLLQAGDLLVDPIRRAAARTAQPVSFPCTRIELTQLGENAGLFGAARLALRQEF